MACAPLADGPCFFAPSLPGALVVLLGLSGPVGIRTGGIDEQTAWGGGGALETPHV